MNKYKKLAVGIIFDAIGLVSYALPGIGEFLDIGWAPLSGWLMTKLYKGKAGKVAGIVSFIEELVPGMDFIPTFTLMWLYTYVFKTQKEEAVVEVNSK